MIRRLIFSVSVVALLFQVIVGVPAMSKPAAASHAGMSTGECGGQAEKSESSCPCCPDGLATSSCTGFCIPSLLVGVFTVPSVSSMAIPPVVSEPDSLPSQIYAPPNPPPIA